MPRIGDNPEMTESETGFRSGSRRRLDALTGLRFFAAAAIVLHHLPGTFGIQHGYLGNVPLAQGVSVFFVLSGFVLRYAYPQLRTAREVRGFLVARVARIWPLHLLTLLAAVLVNWNLEISTFLANFFLLQSWIPKGSYFFGYNAVSWSISTEFAFYLFFPILLFRFRHDWWWKLFSFASFSFAFALYVGAMDIPRFDGDMSTVVMQGFIMTNPLARLFEFVLGMTSAQLWLGSTPRGGPAVWTFLEAVGVIFLLFNVTIILKAVIPLLPATDAVRFWVVANASPALPVAILLPILATGRGIVSAILAHRVVRFMGDASFSIYMTHQLLLIPFRKSHFEFLPVPAQICLYLIVVLLLSSALHVWFEIPCQRAIRRRFGGDRAGAERAGAERADGSPSDPDVRAQTAGPAGVSTSAP